VQEQMSEKRFRHVLVVQKAAVELAKQYGTDVEKASIAGLVHDYAKERPDEEMIALIKQHGLSKEIIDFGNNIWHGMAGWILVRDELGINDPEILRAVEIHTVGAKEMTSLDKIVYVADYIEENRAFPGVERAREIARVSLDEAVKYETKGTLQFLIENEKAVYPQTIETYNAWVVNERMEKFDK